MVAWKMFDASIPIIEYNADLNALSVLRCRTNSTTKIPPTIPRNNPNMPVEINPINPQITPILVATRDAPPFSPATTPARISRIPVSNAKPAKMATNNGSSTPTTYQCETITTEAINPPGIPGTNPEMTAIIRSTIAVAVGRSTARSDSTNGSNTSLQVYLYSV